MHLPRRLLASAILALSLQFTITDAARAAGAVALGGIKTQADLTAAIAATTDPAAKRALQFHAAAVHLAKLKNLKGLELGSNKATSQTLRHLLGLPLEYFQLGEGVDSAGCIDILKEIKTLQRLTLSNGKTLTDADLKTVAGMTHLEHLELGGLPLPPERLPVLKQFAFLKSMRLVPPYPKAVQASIKEVLPNVALRFE